MCQSRLYLLISHLVHERILTSTFRWLAPKKWYAKPVMLIWERRDVSFQVVRKYLLSAMRNQLLNERPRTGLKMVLRITNQKFWVWCHPNFWCWVQNCLGWCRVGHCAFQALLNFFLFFCFFWGFGQKVFMLFQDTLAEYKWSPYIICTRDHDQILTKNINIYERCKDLESHQCVKVHNGK